MSVLQVNTISEVTSANGVTVDGLSLKDGNVVPASGKGIVFSSTNTPAQSAGTGSQNILDDYEEGSFNLLAKGGNSGWSGGSPVDVGSVGTYTKIGKLVNVVVNFSRAGNADGGQWNGSQWIFSGFPFAVARAVTAPFGYTTRTNIHSNCTHFWYLNTAGDIYAFAICANSGGATDVVSQNIAGAYTPNVAFNITYETT